MSEPAVEPSPAARQAQRRRLDRESRDRLRARAATPRQAPRVSTARSAAAAGSAAGPEGAVAGYAAGAAKDAAAAAARARFVPGDRRYQSVILAEFVIAVVVIAGLPLATGGSPAAQAKGGISPYDTGDLKQLVAVGGVYFILALISSGNRGRLAAWFGGLVLIGLAFSKYPLFKTMVQAKQDTGQGTGQQAP